MTLPRHGERVNTEVRYYVVYDRNDEAESNNIRQMKYCQSTEVPSEIVSFVLSMHTARAGPGARSRVNTPALIG